MSDVSTFDWAEAARTQRPIKIRTWHGNTVTGRVKGYVIWQPGPYVMAADSVVIKGTSRHRPGELNRYLCHPIFVSAP